MRSPAPLLSCRSLRPPTRSLAAGRSRSYRRRAAMAPSLGWRHRAPAATAAVALLLLAALAGVPAARAARRETKGVKITVQAKWQATPLLHEAAEFLVSGPGDRRGTGPRHRRSACRPPVIKHCTSVSQCSVCWDSFRTLAVPLPAVALTTRRRTRFRRCSGGLWRSGSAGARRWAARPRPSSAGRASGRPPRRTCPPTWPACSRPPWQPASTHPGWRCSASWRGRAWRRRRLAAGRCWEGQHTPRRRPWRPHWRRRCRPRPRRGRRVPL